MLINEQVMRLKFALAGLVAVTVSPIIISIEALATQYARRLQRRLIEVSHFIGSFHVTTKNLS